MFLLEELSAETSRKI